MMREPIDRNDLTPQEQKHVRLALRFLRARFGGWARLAKALRVDESTVRRTASGFCATASMMVRVARLSTVSIDDLLAGRFPPPGTCPNCGHSVTTEAGTALLDLGEVWDMHS